MVSVPSFVCEPWFYAYFPEGGTFELYRNFISSFSAQARLT